MIDPSTPRGRILLAALACAADRSWAQVSLLDIAEHAKVPLGEMRDLFASKSAIIAELMRTVDREVLQRVADRWSELIRAHPEHWAAPYRIRWRPEAAS